MRRDRATSKSAPNARLQEALGCLDLRLEDELTRYRRQRAGLSVAPIVLRPKQPAKKPLDLMSFGGTATVEAARVTEPPKAISFDLGAAAIGEIHIPDFDESAMVPYTSETAGDPYAVAEASTPPDDYLESSEHLLKSLKREEAKVEVERGFLQSLSTPLGIGSMLTLLVSSAMLGYVIMNPTIVSGLWQNSGTSEVADSSSDSPASESPTGLTPTSPRLDRDEFSDLGLDTLSALQTRPAPIPTIAASPSPTPTQAAAAALVAPTPNASPAPTVVASPQPSPQPMPMAGSSILLPPITVAKSPTATPPNNSAYQYKVEVPFTGDQSLSAARRVIPDAFVRSDGKIQLAAFTNQAEAQRKAQELKSQGIAAEVKP
ncbi:MAG: SPOR domain-containing protein [Leptolyngbya sp. Prado105]|nr:SPOR domain-containing protein [Leptolyngbya sp. Prado105]